jgi:hypothetical protein
LKYNVKIPENWKDKRLPAIVQVRDFLAGDKDMEEVQIFDGDTTSKAYNRYKIAVKYNGLQELVKVQQLNHRVYLVRRDEN